MTTPSHDSYQTRFAASRFPINAPVGALLLALGILGLTVLHRPAPQGLSSEGAPSGRVLCGHRRRR